MRVGEGGCVGAGPSACGVGGGRVAVAWFGGAEFVMARLAGTGPKHRGLWVMGEVRNVGRPARVAAGHWASVGLPSLHPSRAGCPWGIPFAPSPRASRQRAWFLHRLLRRREESDTTCRLA